MDRNMKGFFWRLPENNFRRHSRRLRGCWLTTSYLFQARRAERISKNVDGHHQPLLDVTFDVDGKIRNSSSPENTKRLNCWYPRAVRWMPSLLNIIRQNPACPSRATTSMWSTWKSSRYLRNSSSYWLCQYNPHHFCNSSLSILSLRRLL